MTPEFISGLVVTGSAVGSFLASLLFKFFSNSIDTLFERWRFASADKRKLADQILDICAEGQQSKFTKLPEDDRKIHQLLNYLESIESSILELLVRYYNNWVTTAIVTDRAETEDEEQFATQLQQDTEKYRRQLVRAVGKWKK
jgi:hypothetical protein